MDPHQLTAILCTTAWADGPPNPKERMLIADLLFALGLDREEANHQLEQWELSKLAPEPLGPSLNRQVVLDLLRAQLAIAYSDETFSLDELPHLRRTLDAYQVSSQELTELRLQARSFLPPLATTIVVDPGFITSQNWPQVESAAQQNYNIKRDHFLTQTHEDLKDASDDTLLVMLYRGRSFDRDLALQEFAQRREALILRHGALPDRELLLTQLKLYLTASWERAYSPQCGSCQLQAPQLKNTTCYRCSSLR